jgi:sortase A
VSTVETAPGQEVGPTATGDADGTADGTAGEVTPVPAPRPASGLRRFRTEHHDALISVANWVRNIGAIIILFAAWQLWGTAIAQHHSQAALKQQFDAKVHAHRAPPGKITLLPATLQIPQPPDGQVMAQIQIPAIGVNQYVVSGTNESDLELGPGHYIGTAMPGQAGNVAIAGHRTTHGAPFNRLAELAVGDPIYLTDLSGQRLTYIVAVTPFAVSPYNVSVLNYFGDSRLTLTTCNPEYSARQRLIVVAGFQSASLVKSAHGRVAVDAGHPYKVTISGEAGWNTSLLPAMFLVAGLLVALGLTNRRWARMLGTESRWLILVPIWVAGLFLLFQVMTNFLPAAA